MVLAVVVTVTNAQSVDALIARFASVLARFQAKASWIFIRSIITVNFAITISDLRDAHFLVFAGEFTSMANCVARDLIFTTFAIPISITTLANVYASVIKAFELIRPTAGPPIRTSIFVRSIPTIDLPVALHGLFNAFSSDLASKLASVARWASCLISAVIAVHNSIAAHPGIDAVPVSTLEMQGRVAGAAPFVAAIRAICCVVTLDIPALVKACAVVASAKDIVEAF